MERITFHFLWHQAFHFFTHLEKGFLFTSGQLLRSPGKTVIDYIDGKRSKYQPPVSYFLIWITIYALLLLLTDSVFGQGTVLNYGDYFGRGATTRFAISHLALVLSVLFPLFALYLHATLSGGRFNYFECMAAVIFVLGTIILSQSVFVLLAIILSASTGHAVNLVVSDAFKIAYLAWFSFNFASLHRLRHKWLRATLFAAMCFGTFSVWRIFVFPLVAGHFVVSH